MDRNFHTDDFERLLREKSDEFRMYPSKRIWHSIYNNIHPGRKWPSVAMTITLISALFLVGYLNTKNTTAYQEEAKEAVQQKGIVQSHIPRQLATTSSPANFVNSNKISATTSAVTNDNTIAILTGNLNATKGNGLQIKSAPAAKSSGTGNNSAKVTINNAIGKGGNLINPFADNTLNPSGAASLRVYISASRQIETASHDQLTVADDQIDKINEDVATSGFLTAAQKIAGDDLTKVLVTNFKTAENSNKTNVAVQFANPIISKTAVAENTKGSISTEDKEWIENYALYHRPATKKWANKLAWQFYATPSVVYRSLSEDMNFGYPVSATPPIALSAFNQDVNTTVNQKPSVGFEVGTGFLYSVSRLVKLKAGIQINYTRYNAEAFQNTHPAATKLTMHDYEANLAYEEIRNTAYSNKSGIQSVKLHNETFQVSLPVGADLKLMGNKILQWNFGITIQPTYVVAGRSYLISSDRRNYIQESSMLNKWNLNAGFETFLSYKASNGITFQLGPQLRTQLFTTNRKQIAVEEKLHSYGLKFGISKMLK